MAEAKHLSAFKKGDLVVWFLGGPLMVIDDQLEDASGSPLDGYKCAWFTAEGRFLTGTFSAARLVLAGTVPAVPG